VGPTGNTAASTAATSRRCSRTACGRGAVTTLTYVYADQTAVLGPLSTYAEPHAYDLCEQHSERLSAPRGWEVLRLAQDYSSRGPSEDDLLALADAVRETGRPQEESRPAPLSQVLPAQVQDNSQETARNPARETSRRGHLRVLTSDDPGDNHQT
jgi:Protein of unknown function (DUF3499)